jgi:8-oxo-dGTP pyrophosphatase MutT (NUDIX family)
VDVEVRHTARAVLLDPEDRILLVHWINVDNGVDVWLMPGGGIEDGEDVETALRRELREETGLQSFDAGPTIWMRRHAFPWYGRTIDQHETFVLVRVAAFDPDPDPAEVDVEGGEEVRWWTPAELEASDATFSPRRLAALLRELLASGPPPEPRDAGV